MGVDSISVPTHFHRHHAPRNVGRSRPCAICTAATAAAATITTTTILLLILLPGVIAAELRGVGERYLRGCSAHLEGCDGAVRREGHACV